MTGFAELERQVKSYAYEFGHPSPAVLESVSEHLKDLRRNGDHPAPFTGCAWCAAAARRGLLWERGVQGGTQ